MSDIILLDVLKPTGMPPSDCVLDNSANTCYAKNWQANEVAKMWSQNGKMSIAKMGYEERHCGDLNIFAAGEGKSICRVSGFSDWDCHREVREAECGSIKIIETVPPRAAPRSRPARK